MWRNARVIYDCGLQTGRMSREDAVRLMTDRVGFLRWAAEAEVDSALSRPGYFIGYFIGDVRDPEDARRLSNQDGRAFFLREFHEQLLRMGTMPPALVREALLH